MKIKFLPLLLLPICIASQAVAQEWEYFVYSPYDADAIYAQEAASYIEYVEDNWQFYRIGKRSWKQLEKITMAKFSSTNFDISFQLGIRDLKPGIKSKIRYKGKTINLVFEVTD